MADITIQSHEALQRAGIDASTLETLPTSSVETYYAMSAPGTQVIQLWRQLRTLVSHTSLWPVLIGGDNELAALREYVSSQEFGTTKEILDAAARLDPYLWLEERHEELIDEILEFGGPLFSPSADESLGDREDFRAMPRGPWPEQASPSGEFLIPLHPVTKEPLQKVNVVLVPTVVCWHVPAYLRYGGWNECPSREVQVAMMKLWQDHYGAEVVGIAGDVVEMQVERPPSTKLDALRLAKQQYLYCQDIVDQGTRTLESLAAVLLDGTSWFFWWD